MVTMVLVLATCWYKSVSTHCHPCTRAHSGPSGGGGGLMCPLREHKQPLPGIRGWGWYTAVHNPSLPPPALCSVTGFKTWLHHESAISCNLNYPSGLPGPWSPRNLAPRLFGWEDTKKYL